MSIQKSTVLKSSLVSGPVFTDFDFEKRLLGPKALNLLMKALLRRRMTKKIMTRQKKIKQGNAIPSPMTNNDEELETTCAAATTLKVGEVE